MKIGIVIVNYNDFNSTKDLLENIKYYKCINKIVVVDNCSTDDSYEKLCDIELKKLKVIRSDSNDGYSSAINIGSKYLIDLYKHCYIIISNSDIIIKDEKDIEKLIQLMEIKKLAVVAPTILEHGEVNRGWKLPSPLIDSLLNIVFIHRYLRKVFLLYKNNHYKKEKSIVDAVSGCFFIIDSKAMKEIDYLDTNVFLYYEENILGSKLKKKHLKTAISNYVQVVHNHSVTVDKNINKINKYKILKKSQYYYHVNYNNANVVEKGLLLITNKLTYVILYCYYYIKDMVRKSN